MPLQLLPLEEADVPHYVDITWAAARGDLMGAMFPNGFFEDDRQWLINDKTQAMRKHASTTKTMKIVDTDLPDDHPTGKIISVASWKIYPRERTEEEMEAEKKEGEERGHAPHASAPMLEAFFTQMGKCKKEILGNKAVVYLGILMTHPDHHRRGAGAMQLQWGFDLANEVSAVLIPNDRPSAVAHTWQELIRYWG